jgi:uncharacterized protein (TIGR03083 family)
VNRDESWQVIAGQRLALAAALEPLSDAQWDTPSLCAGWRVRDVAAHVALAPQAPGIGAMIADVARARGSFHRFNRDVSVRHAAARTGAQLVAELRAHATSRRLPAVTSYRNTLFDVLVHAQDIAVPLGWELPTPRDGALAATQRVWAMGWPFWARRRLRGVRLTATDVDWAAGAGAEVRGPIDALLLVLTGRAGAVRHRLTGPGVAGLSAAPTTGPHRPSQR